MNKKEIEKNAAFRFSVIYPLLDVGKEQWGEKSRLLDEHTAVGFILLEDYFHCL